MNRIFFAKDYSSESSAYSDFSDSDQEDIQLESTKAPVSKRNKFLKGAPDSDDSSSSSDNDMFSSDEEEDVIAKKQRGAKKFLKTEASDDDDSDDGARIVKSARDKRFEEMRSLVRVMNNGKKIGDWISVQNGLFLILLVEFDKLVKAHGKTVNSFTSSGTVAPRFYVRSLVQLEDAVKAAAGESKDAKKKLNALNAKALNAMKQKLKKYCKTLETEMQAFREVFQHLMPESR